MGSLEDVMKDQYGFSEHDGFEEIKVKTGEDFPYRIKPKGDCVTLSQSFSSRANVKPTFKKIGDYATREQALAVIVERHNKSCIYMQSWKKIEKEA